MTNDQNDRKVSYESLENFVYRHPNFNKGLTLGIVVVLLGTLAYVSCPSDERYTSRIESRVLQE